MSSVNQRNRTKREQKPRIPAGKAPNEGCEMDTENGGGGGGCVDDDYDRELYWCIQELELSQKNMKQGLKHAEETMKLLKVLRNPKSSLVKKRQIMRSAFGDYRKKMKDQEKQFQKDFKKMTLEKAGEKKTKGSTFYKRSNRTTQLGTGATRSVAEIDANLKFNGSSGQNFAFNFEISPSTVDGSTSVTSATADLQRMEISGKRLESNSNQGDSAENFGLKCAAIDSKPAVSSEASGLPRDFQNSDIVKTVTSDNSFHWTPSANPFAFNFSV
ncbi:uncharacterized protein LOC141909314 [Tubulanus polymorphus]|uniref:uncharacterized protein LOC141909314 n=1 Tax=Tubulanus polymorphus TaxID=672921 RepID=UPI003DA3865F